MITEKDILAVSQQCEQRTPDGKIIVTRESLNATAEQLRRMQEQLPVGSAEWSLCNSAIAVLADYALGALAGRSVAIIKPFNPQG